MAATFVLLLTLSALAQQNGQDLNPHLSYLPASNSEAAGNNAFVETKERTITINGVEYRQIEYKGDVFVVRGDQPDTTVDCTIRPETKLDQFAASGELKIAKRTKLYIESLRQYCDPGSRRIVTSPDLGDSDLGVKFEGKKSQDGEKKVFINPANKTGGAGITF